MKWMKRLAILLILLAGIAYALPYVIPVNVYIPTVQRVASAKLNEPVSIGGLSFALLPLPSVTAHELAIGKAQEVKMASLTVRPDVLSLLTGVVVLRAVELDTFNLDPALLGRLRSWLESDAAIPGVVVRKVSASNVTLAFEHFNWGLLRADADLDRTGVSMAELGTQDRRLTVTLTPRSEGFHVAIVGNHWKIPLKPSIEFEALEGAGLVSGGGLDLTSIEGKLYGGDLHATGHAEWKDGISVKGTLRTVDVDLRPIMDLIDHASPVSGRLHANGKFELAAAEAGRLADSLRASLEFDVKKGVLYNVDLASAARSAADSGARGGQTGFNDLTGTLNLVGKAAQLRNLKIASGLLQGRGSVDIAASDKLSGMLSVEVKSRASAVRTSLDVSGTFAEPILRPSRTAPVSAVN